MNKSIAILALIITVLSCRNAPSKSIIYSTIIADDSKVIKEDYFNESSETTKNNIQSLTKSIISLLVGIAIEKGHIPNENVTISTYFPDYFSKNEDKQKEKITIKHLLNQTSGLAWAGYTEHAAWINSENQVAFVLDKKLEHSPGETYNYNSGGTHILSVILSKATGQSTLEFANENLFLPLGISNVSWEKCKDGIYDGAGFGLEMQAKDLVKIGQLMLNEGMLGDSTIVSSAWIDKLVDSNEKKSTFWGIPNSKHGYCWYSAELNDNKIIYGMGYGGQFIFVIPSKNRIIVATHEHDTPDGIDQQVDFIKRTLPALLEE